MRSSMLRRPTRPSMPASAAYSHTPAAAIRQTCPTPTPARQRTYRKSRGLKELGRQARAASKPIRQVCSLRTGDYAGLSNTR